MARFERILKHFALFIGVGLTALVLLLGMPVFCNVSGIVYWPMENTLCVDESCNSLELTKNLLEFNVTYQPNHVILPISMKSHIRERAVRDVIRSTWGATASKLGMAVVFYIGRGNKTEESELTLELAVYHDIIQINIPDVFEHQGYKELAMLATERRLFPDAKMYAHIDTDVAVIPRNLLQVYRNITASEHSPSMHGIKLVVKSMTLKNPNHRWANVDESVFAKRKFDILWGASLLLDASALQLMLPEARIEVAKKCAWASDFFLGYLASAAGVKLSQTAGFNVRNYILQKRDPDTVKDIITSHQWTAKELETYFGGGQL